MIIHYGFWSLPYYSWQPEIFDIIVKTIISVVALLSKLDVQLQQNESIWKSSNSTMRSLLRLVGLTFHSNHFYSHND